MVARDREKRFVRAVEHDVRSAASVDVEVDEPRRDEKSGRVDDRLRVLVRRRRDRVVNERQRLQPFVRSVRR